jgi:hypothetical protein
VPTFAPPGCVRCSYTSAPGFAAEAARQARLLAEWEASLAGREEMAFWAALASEAWDVIDRRLAGRRWETPSSPGDPGRSLCDLPTLVLPLASTLLDLPLVRVTVEPGHRLGCSSARKR